jgi:branched-chain amino acid transport system ATP-binding protein
VIAAIFRPAWMVEEATASADAETLLGFFGDRLPRRDWRRAACRMRIGGGWRSPAPRDAAAALLLDEPTAGELQLEMTGVIRAIRDRGVTALLIEHDMQVIMGRRSGDRAELRELDGKDDEDVARHPAVVEATWGRWRRVLRLREVDTITAHPVCAP